jgi:protein SCO1
MTRHSAARRFVWWLTALAVLLSMSHATRAAAGPPARHAMTGVVIEVDPSRTRFVVSHDSVPGVMAAMTMPFDVRQPKELDGIAAGTPVEFTLVIERETAYAEKIKIRRYENNEQDPFTARRLKLLQDLTRTGPKTEALPIGRGVPDFTLIDQSNRPVTLSQFRDKVVAINFVYTNCALPQFCFRIANHFGVLQRRFKDRLSKDLVLLTVTFDPARDGPEAMARYAQSLKADPHAWRFLTGGVDDVRRVCELFGVDFFPDEGLMNHSSHTAVIGRDGTLVANLEGNQFTAVQLGDLVDTVLKR